MVNKKYPYQVWLTSIIFSSILLTIYFICTSKGNLFSAIVFSTLVPGAYITVFSLPCFLLYLIFFKIISRGTSSLLKQKVSLAILGVTLALGMNYLVFFYFEKPLELFKYTFPSVAAFSILLSSYLFEYRRAA